jgi:hypothetical protein
MQQWYNTGPMIVTQKLSKDELIPLLIRHKESLTLSWRYLRREARFTRMMRPPYLNMVLLKKIFGELIIIPRPVRSNTDR